MHIPKNDKYYIEKIINDLQFIIRQLDNISYSDFHNNELLLDSMMFRLIQISESTQKLTNGYKTTHNNIPWHLLYALRNRIVHDYGNVDLNIIYSTLTNDIPELLVLINPKA